VNTPSDVVTDPQAPLPAVHGRDVPLARQLYWSVRRELWENRSVYMAPLAVGAVSLAGFFIWLAHLPQTMRGAAALAPMQQHEAVQRIYVIVALILMAIEMLVAVVYCLDALYAERRDRSVLFWKSLPVSDGMAVLSKACVPILVLPLVAFAVTFATQVTMLLVSSAVLAAAGMSPAPLWEEVSVVRVSWINLFHLVGFHGFWYAPLYGWLLMVSAWSKRAPFLWATLPPIAVGLVERIAFNTSHFATMLRDHFLGGPQDSTPGTGMTMDMLAPHPVGHFLMGPGLWIGLAVTAAFLMGAIWLRRSREAI
jgi:ABC-2 type transport system permease protein